MCRLKSDLAHGPKLSAKGEAVTSGLSDRNGKPVVDLCARYPGS